MEDAVNDDNSVVALSLAKVSPSHDFEAYVMRKGMQYFYLELNAYCMVKLVLATSSLCLGFGHQDESANISELY